MAKFSQGPWIFTEWGEIEAPNEYVVAKIPHIDKRIRGKERREEHEHRNGNGRLIAASPDLLEALQEIMVDLCAGYEGPTVDKAYAAIAKALGDA